MWSVGFALQAVGGSGQRTPATVSHQRECGCKGKTKYIPSATYYACSNW